MNTARGSMPEMAIRLPSDGRARVLLAALGLGLGIGAVVCGVRALGALQGAELRAYDALVRLRAVATERAASPRVALVRIREEEIAALGHPLPDAALARALDRIAAARPAAIGVDLHRVPPPADAGPEQRADWRALETSARHSAAIFVEKAPEGALPGVPAPRFAQAAGRVGFSDLLLDPDGVVRRGLLMLWDPQGRPSLAFSLQLALQALAPRGIGLAPARTPEHVRLGDTALPPLEAEDGPYVDVDARGYQLPLDFAAGRDAFPSYPFTEVLAGRVAADAFADRIVIVGTTAPTVRDDFVTPLGAQPLTYGMEVHAHATDQLLRAALGGAAPLAFATDRSEWAWIVGWSIAGALVGLGLRTPLLFAGGSALLLGAVGGVCAFAFLEGLWLPLVPPGLAALASGALVVAEAARRQRAERAVVMDLFGRFVSRRVAGELWDARAAFMDGGRPRPQRFVATAMLTDLTGYTNAAEKMDPAALMAWLNEYMDRMTQVIEDHGGFVDDYTGDGIKANFGVPLARQRAEQIAEDARSAVRCALAMGAALEALCEQWHARGLPPARMRIGIFTGEVVVGSIGSARRMKYTTVGDTVNTAARLESFDKEGFGAEAADPRGVPYRILVGESTWQHLGDGFETEPLGEHVMKGRGAPVGIHRVRGLRPDARRGVPMRDAGRSER